MKRLCLAMLVGFLGCSGDGDEVSCASCGDLSGCCSSHGGVDQCFENGDVMCRDGHESPTCDCR
jgi:hypothetical protein